MTKLVNMDLTLMCNVKWQHTNTSIVNLYFSDVSKIQRLLQLKNTSLTWKYCTRFHIRKKFGMDELVTYLSRWKSRLLRMIVVRSYVRTHLYRNYSLGMDHKDRIRQNLSVVDQNHLFYWIIAPKRKMQWYTWGFPSWQLHNTLHGYVRPSFKTKSRTTYATQAW